MPYTDVDVDIVVSKIVSYKDIADKPKINGYELNGEVSLEDIGLGNTVQYIDYEYEGEQKRGIQLDNNVNIVGVTTTGDGASLVNLSKLDVADFGSPKVHMNLNTKDIVTVNDSEGVMTNKNLIGFLKAGSNMSITQVEETYPGTETPYQLTKFDVDAYTKAEADSKFATAEQGAKADTAVQPESISDMLTKAEANTTYAKTSSLATVSTTGSYNDLTNKPSIPTLNKVATMLRINKTGLNETVTTGTKKDLLSLVSLTGSADNVVTVANIETTDFSLTTGVLKLPNYTTKGYASTYCDYNIDIRLTGTIAGNVNTSREFSLELQRADNTLIERKAVIKINDTTLGSRGTVFETYTLGADDPFILNGLRLVLNNTSGQEIVLTGLSIIIKCVTF